ncbi:MAG: hypothetical protein J0I12_14535 [Candidatus Eremiobacteraeota bacterium]|nr:hypothetical protein [Candidatus Eremiobacteraeota bacterium]
MKKQLVLCLAVAALGCNSPADVANSLHITEATVNLAIEHFESAEPAPSYSPSKSNYVDNLFGNITPSTVALNLGLPNYTYLQGLVVSRQNVFLAGQVRVVGGIVATGNTTVAGDGMVTTNPDSQIGRVTVSRARWKVEAWVQE